VALCLDVEIVLTQRSSSLQSAAILEDLAKLFDEVPPNTMTLVRSPRCTTLFSRPRDAVCLSKQTAPMEVEEEKPAKGRRSSVKPSPKVCPPCLVALAGRRPSPPSLRMRPFLVLSQAAPAFVETVTMEKPPSAKKATPAKLKTPKSSAKKAKTTPKSAKKVATPKAGSAKKKTPAKKTPGKVVTASIAKKASPKARGVADLKKKRAADAAAKHKARMAAIRAQKSGGKMEGLKAQRAKAHGKPAVKRTPVKTAKDWDAIHAKAEAKQESLVSFVARKTAAGATPVKAKALTPNKLRFVVKKTKAVAVRPVSKAKSPKASVKKSPKPSPKAASKRAIVGGKIVKSIAKPSIRGGSYKTGTFAKPTPQKSENTAPKAKFDLKASLAKKPSWTVKKGTVSKFKDTQQIPSVAFGR